jgi:hypothetical protein
VFLRYYCPVPAHLPEKLADLRSGQDWRSADSLWPSGAAGGDRDKGS